MLVVILNVILNGLQFPVSSEREWCYTYRTGIDNVQQKQWVKYESDYKLISLDIGPTLSVVLSTSVVKQAFADHN